MSAAVMSDVRTSAKRSLDDTERPATLHLNSGEFKMDMMTPTTPKSPPREEPASDRDPSRTFDFIKVYNQHSYSHNVIQPYLYGYDSAMIHTIIIHFALCQNRIYAVYKTVTQCHSRLIIC